MGRIVGKIDFKLTADSSYKIRSNLARVANPQCKMDEKYVKTFSRNISECAETRLEKSNHIQRRAKRLIRKSQHELELTASDQRLFGEPQGIKRWIKMKIKKLNKNLISNEIETSEGLNFPVWPVYDTCESLIITLDRETMNVSV